MGGLWKGEERKVAKLFNTSRALMKGTGIKEDIISDIFCVDCKLRKAWQIEKWFKELKDYAQKHKKVPILTIRKPGTKLRLAIVELDYLIELLKNSGYL